MRKLTVENFGDAFKGRLMDEEPEGDTYPINTSVSVLEVLQWIRKHRPDLFQTILRPTLPPEAKNLDARAEP